MAIRDGFEALALRYADLMGWNSPWGRSAVTIGAFFRGAATAGTHGRLGNSCVWRNSGGSYRRIEFFRRRSQSLGGACPTPPRRSPRSASVLIYPPGTAQLRRNAHPR